MATVGKKGKPGAGDRETEPPPLSDSKRFKQEASPGGSQSPKSPKLGSAKRSSPKSSKAAQHVSSGLASQTVTTAAAAAASLKSQKIKPPKEKKDGCCLKSTSTSSQNLSDQGVEPAAPSRARRSQSPAKSPKSSIFTRFLHRQGQGHGAAEGDGQKNAKASKGAESGKSSPKSPKSRLSDGRLKLFNRSSSLKEVKITLPGSTKSNASKSPGQHSTPRASALRQPNNKLEESSFQPTKVFFKNKDPSRVKTVQVSIQQPDKDATEEDPKCSTTRTPATNKAEKATDRVGSDGAAQGATASGDTGVHNGNVEAMDTSAAKDEVPKCRRDSVQAWVNSISDERLDGVEDMDHQDAAAGGAGVAMEMTPSEGAGAGTGVKADDDELTLGAEAKLMTPPKDVVLSRTTKSRLAEVGAASGRNRQSAWREMFSSIKTESFNSEGSAHSVRTWDSIEQLIHERSGDPEEILTNLGFHSQEANDSLPSRIPDRFLRQPSVARGVSVEKFIDSNPDLKEYVALTRSLSEPSTASLASGASQPWRRSSQKSTSLANVVKMMMLIHRMGGGHTWKEIDAIRKWLAPADSATARLQNVSYASVAPSGQEYLSILHPDNSEHLAEQGAYDSINRTSRSASVASIPERFACENPAPLTLDIPEVIPPSPPTSPSSRIPTRFSACVSPHDSSAMLPLPDMELEFSGDTYENETNINGPDGQMNRKDSPSLAPVKQTSALWKRLSDLGLASENLNYAENEPLRPKSIINVSRISQYPDIPLRFFLHHQDSILNAGFAEELSDVLAYSFQDSKMEPPASAPSNHTQNSEDCKKDAVCITVTKDADGVELKDVPSDYCSDAVQKLTVILYTPNEPMVESIETKDDLIKGSTPGITKVIKKRKLDPQGTVDQTMIEDDTKTNATQPDSLSSKKARRKLGTQCTVADQKKLLQELDIEALDTNSCRLDVASLEQQAPGMVGVAISHPRGSIADDEAETSDMSLKSREKVSKHLRWYLSQEKDADDSNSDGSVGDPTEPVEIGTAVMVNVLVHKVKHIFKESPAVVPPQQVTDPEDEAMTTDQGSISCDDVHDIYEIEQKTFEVNTDDILSDSAAICVTGQNSEWLYNNVIRNVEENGQSADDIELFVRLKRAKQNITVTTGEEDLSKNAKRRAIISTGLVRDQESQLTAEYYERHQVRWSDSNIKYSPDKMSERRQKFSFYHQEHVRPQDLDAILDLKEVEKEPCNNVQNTNNNNNAVSATNQHIQSEIGIHLGLDNASAEHLIEKNMKNVCDVITGINNNAQASETSATDLSDTPMGQWKSKVYNEELLYDSTEKFRDGVECAVADGEANSKEADLRESSAHYLSQSGADIQHNGSCVDESVIGIAAEQAGDIPAEFVVPGVEYSNGGYLIMSEVLCEVNEATFQDVHQDKGSYIAENKTLMVPQDNGCLTPQEDLSSHQAGSAKESPGYNGTCQSVSNEGDNELVDFSSHLRDGKPCRSRQQHHVAAIVHEHIRADNKTNFDVVGEGGDVTEENYVCPIITKDINDIPIDDAMSTDEIVFTNGDVAVGLVKLEIISNDNVEITKPLDIQDILLSASEINLLKKEEGLNQISSYNQVSGVHCVDGIMIGERNREQTKVSNDHYTNDGQSDCRGSEMVRSVERRVSATDDQPKCTGLKLTSGIPDTETEVYEPKNTGMKAESSGVEVPYDSSSIGLDVTNQPEELVGVPEISSGLELTAQTEKTEVVVEVASICSDVNDKLVELEFVTGVGCIGFEVKALTPMKASGKVADFGLNTQIGTAHLDVADTLARNIMEAVQPECQQLDQESSEHKAYEISTLRFTESDGDGSIHNKKDDDDHACIPQEQLIDDNVHDRSLSEHAYLSDLLLQLKRNRQNMEQPQLNSSNDRCINHQLPCTLSPVVVTCGDLVADAPLSCEHTLPPSNLMAMRVIPDVPRVQQQIPRINDIAAMAECSRDWGWSIEAHCGDDPQDYSDHILCDDMLSAHAMAEDEMGIVPSLTVQYSFDLEENSSEDFSHSPHPKSSPDKQLAKGRMAASKRCFSRAFSGQSDSSGFVEMDAVDGDSQDLKIPGTSLSGGLSHSTPTTHTPREQHPTHKDTPPPAMGSVSSAIDDHSNIGDKTNDKAKSESDAEEKLWNIIENGHPITHKDFLFGAPSLTKLSQSDKRPVKPLESLHGGRTRMRPPRRQRPPAGMTPPQKWVSRMYIDPPVSPKVTPHSKMEVKFMIDEGRIKDIENAHAVPVEPIDYNAANVTCHSVVRQQRAVSYLHLCVSRAEGEFQIKPVGKGDFMVPKFTGGMAGSSLLDVTQHQVLCAMLSQASTAWVPDTETVRQCNLWNTESATSAQRQEHMHLLEEVRLIQHAITKFKVEFRVLDLRTKTIYAQGPESLTPDQRSELAELENLRSQIQQEIQELERHLADRLRTVVCGDRALYMGDLASLTTMQQVVDLLKEQVYHTSIVRGLAETHAAPTEPGASADPVSLSADQRGDIVNRLSVMQGSMEEHLTQMTAQFSATMEQMRQTLLAEVRDSVRAETEGLRKQVSDAETEVRGLKAKLHDVSNVRLEDGSIEEKAAVGFSVTDSPPASVEALTKKGLYWGSGDADGSTDECIELQVSHSHRVEESPIERGFRPISKQDSGELEHM